MGNIRWENRIHSRVHSDDNDIPIDHRGATVVYYGARFDLELRVFCKGHGAGLRDVDAATCHFVSAPGVVDDFSVDLSLRSVKKGVRGKEQHERCMGEKNEMRREMGEGGSCYQGRARL